MNRFLIFLLACFCTCASAQEFIYEDALITENIRKGLEKAYNFEFEEAEKIYLEVQEKYPLNPAYNFLMAMNTYWKLFYNNTYKEKSGEYLSFLQKALKHAEALEEKFENHPEVIFFHLAIHSSYALYYVNNKENLKAIAEAKKTYHYIRQGYPLKSKYPELYFSAGIYDFYREQYPETHPGYKSVLWMFASGDREKGLQELETACRTATFTQTEAHHYLVLIFLKYMNKPSAALPHSEYLANKYPRNIHFLMKHAEALVLNANYEEAEKLNHTLHKSGRKLYEMASYVFYGIIYEKHKGRTDLAVTYYEYAIKLSRSLEQPVNEYLGFAYSGPARIAMKEGDKVRMKEYYEKALETSHYTSVVAEAQKALNP